MAVAETAAAAAAADNSEAVDTVGTAALVGSVGSAGTAVAAASVAAECSCRHGCCLLCVCESCSQLGVKGEHCWLQQQQETVQDKG